MAVGVPLLEQICTLNPQVNKTDTQTMLLQRGLHYKHL